MKAARVLGSRVQGYGITLTSEAAAQAAFSWRRIPAILEEVEPIIFSALWSPHNRSQALLNLLALSQRKSEGAKSP
jgi:hypothetical protein